MMVTRREGDGVCTRGGPRRWLAAAAQRGVAGKGAECEDPGLAGRYLWDEGRVWSSWVRH